MSSALFLKVDPYLWRKCILEILGVTEHIKQWKLKLIADVNPRNVESQFCVCLWYRYAPFVVVLVSPRPFGWAFGIATPLLGVLVVSPRPFRCAFGIATPV